MKKTITLIIAISIVIASCSTKKEEQPAVVIPPAQMSCKINDTLTTFTKIRVERCKYWGANPVETDYIIASNAKCSIEVSTPGGSCNYEFWCNYNYVGYSINYNNYNANSTITQSTIDGNPYYNGTFSAKLIDTSGVELIITNGIVKYVRG